MRHLMVAALFLSTARAGWCCGPAFSPEALVFIAGVAVAPVVFSLVAALLQSFRSRLPLGYALAALVAAFLMGGVLEGCLCGIHPVMGYFASLFLGPLASWWVTRCIGLPLQQAEPTEPGFSPAG